MRLCGWDTLDLFDFSNLPMFYMYMQILTWCVANPSTAEAKLQRAIVVYCHQVGVDCSVIKPGGSCYLPNTVIDHASVVLNLYYTANNKINSFCPNFANITTNNPSHGSCKFP
ncbi:Glucan endo-1,3-beta-D-glucosidase [Camellia lanceoleosa]|nr:Glucan endo-1,3-beta-D-glucosidase [Camellia lanceoleosa]